jgi:hypothetical protein
MQPTTRIEIPPRLLTLFTLAQLLERFDRSSTVDATQYQSIVKKLIVELKRVEHDETLKRLMDVFPSLSELYENLNYEAAGLCRSHLEASIEAEAAARAVMVRATGASRH